MFSLKINLDGIKISDNWTGCDCNIRLRCFTIFTKSFGLQDMTLSLLVLVTMLLFTLGNINLLLRQIYLEEYSPTV